MPIKPTYFIKTFGCQMNISDSERIASFLEEQNFSLANKIEDADLAIFNTCGIKQTAENRAYSMINNLRKKNKNRVSVAMTGCLANRSDVQKRMKQKVDLFFAIKDLKIFENWIIENCLKIDPSAGRCKLKIPNKKNKPLSQEEISYLTIEPKYLSEHQAHVPIMTGCNNFCSYCVVPYARGQEQSRNADEIIKEIKKLVAKDFKHIILLGQNVNSYHGAWDAEHKTKIVRFPQLLKKINAIPGKFWISFVSSHPKDMSEELIETVTKCKKVCEWIHLPLQAGDNNILKKMNRKYTQEHYLKLVEKIKQSFRKNKPDNQFAISSDIIVGFPSETKKQFLQSAFVMEKAKFDMVFFGQFSPRPGTVAWNMKDNVTKKEKERREKILNEILKKTAHSNNQAYLNKKIEVIIEKEKDGFYYGKTRTMKNVKILANKKGLVGKFAKVLITKANTWNLEGTQI